MNILIIENEIYLAQKVVSRLLDDGHSCDYVESANVNLSKYYDIVLLSTSLPNSAYKNIIKKYKESIILLLVSYISDETVTNPIKAGAKDYIMKPFIMDELVRKIYHYKEFRNISQELETMKEYLNFIFKDIDTDNVSLSTSLPLLVKTNTQKCVDKLAFQFASRFGLTIKFISASKDNYLKEISNTTRELIYVTDYHTLKKSAKDALNKVIEEKTCIICSLENEENFPYEKAEIKKSDLVVINDNIMTINDYVKLMVVSFQSKYPDTELSKKLGISRKSLWEKRKKLGIEKKK
ncbi:response regulator [Arcobacter sp. HD9-500m-PIT-SAG03]|nr:response regulator [Arcobacter sp. HD9-500m-PIT-SAG03]